MTRGEARPRALVLYHYLWPDDVVSSLHLSQLCEGLAARGWEVTGMPCDRGCRDEGRRYPKTGERAGVRYERVWRPGWRQATARGRMLNSLWMTGAWCARSVGGEAPDVVIVGTDPVMSVAAAAVWKRVRPKTVTAHWCFDLYPEAAVADGLLRAGSGVVRAMQRVAGAAYRSCDVIADLGPCMRERIAGYGTAARLETLTPWALEEPAGVLPVDEGERARVFGPGVRLGMLYSGNFGRAHSGEEMLALAEGLRGDGGVLALSVRGNRAGELVEKAKGLAREVGFAEETGLAARLGCADVHVVSLREEWTGMVVPSKFFGALAAGRPVVFAGGEGSGVARWVREHGVGWVVRRGEEGEVVRALRGWVGNAEAVGAMRERCWRVYREEFSRERVVGRWDGVLREEVGRVGG